MLPTPPICENLSVQQQQNLSKLPTPPSPPHPSSSLPQNFEPRDCDIICGRGKGLYNKPGNKRFRSVVRDFIPQYTAAKSRFDKTMVFNAIISKVQTDNDSRFVRRVRKEWVELTLEAIREKVGHTLREALALSSSDGSSSGSASSSARPSKARSSSRQLTKQRAGAAKRTPVPVPQTSAAVQKQSQYDYLFALQKAALAKYISQRYACQGQLLSEQ